jgi:8-oxo-dGTP pyrophosphatase MutT (NUDIX family)
LEDVLVTKFPLRGDAFADEFPAGGIENDAFDFGASQVNADFVFGHNESVASDRWDKFEVLVREGQAGN